MDWRGHRTTKGRENFLETDEGTNEANSTEEECVF